MGTSRKNRKKMKLFAFLSLFSTLSVVHGISFAKLFETSLGVVDETNATAENEFNLNVDFQELEEDIQSLQDDLGFWDDMIYGMADMDVNATIKEPNEV